VRLAVMRDPQAGHNDREKDPGPAAQRLGP
jgi:hypothetical protein